MTKWLKKKFFSTLVIIILIIPGCGTIDRMKECHIVDNANFTELGALIKMIYYTKQDKLKKRRVFIK